MKKAILTLMLLSLATVAFAQVDPAENGIGLYFDMDATEVCLTTAAPFTPISAYLLATNITEESGISGWEMEVLIDGPLVAAAWELIGIQPLNVFTAPVFAVGLGEHGLANPIVNNVVHLATLTAYVLAPTDQVSFGIKPHCSSSWNPPAPGYAAGNNAGNLVPFLVSGGGFDALENPVAQINTDECSVVSNDDVSFGSVKALYR